MKFLAYCICAVLFQAATDIPQKYQPAPPDSKKVVARVDGKDITAGEVMPYLWDWRAGEALEDIINFKVVKNQADKLKISIPEAEVEKELAAQMERVKASLQPGEDLESYIRDQGFPKSRLYLRLYTELLLDQIVMQSFDPNRYVEVSTIIVRPKSEAATDLADAIQIAQKAFDELRGGAKWDDVLKKYNQEPSALATNGRLGWRMIGVFPGPVKEDLATLKIGDYTRPAQTQNGIQIFRLDRRGKEAIGDDLEALKNQFRAEARQNILDQIRKDAKVERLMGKAPSTVPLP